MGLSPNKAKKPPSTTRAIPKKKDKGVKRYTIGSFEGEEDFYVPMHSFVGSRNMNPFTDVFLEEDMTTGGKYPYGAFSLADHLVYLRVTNEQGKFPQVNFQVYINDPLRMRIAIDNRIERLKIGARIRVSYGYGYAHTIEGPYTIDSREISYESGAVLLKIEAKMGLKMRKITTSDVFTNTGNATVMDKLASLADMQIDYSLILDEERERLLSINRSKSGNDTLASKMYFHAIDQGLSLYVNPVNGNIKLATPFVVDLVDKGLKPLKMTYGYPNSNITSISLEEKGKVASKKGAKSSQETELTEERVGGLDLKTGRHRVSLAKTLAAPGGGVTFIGPINLADRVAKATENKTALQIMQERFPKKGGYVIKVDQRVPQVAGEVSFEIEKTVEAKNLQLDRDTTEVDIDTYNSLVGQQNKVVLLESGQITEEGKVKVIVYDKVSVTPVKGGKGKSKEIQSTTTQTDTKAEGTTIQFRPVKGVRSIAVRAGEIDLKDLRNITPIESNFKSLGDVALKLSEMQEMANSDRDRYRIVEQKANKAFVLYSLEEKVEVKIKKDPAKVDKKDEIDKETPTVASGDGETRPSNGPAGAGIKGNGIQAYISSKELKISLATGDFLVSVGRVIELVDLDKELNGIYEIKAVEHEISDNGFSTNFSCKQAISKKKHKKAKKEDTASTRKQGQTVNVFVPTTATDKERQRNKDFRDVLIHGQTRFGGF